MYYYDERAHSITFSPVDEQSTSGKINTWEKWHVIPTSKPYVSPPDVKEEYVEIPGMNGALDYTDLLSGSPVYSMRKGKWEFAVLTAMDGVNENKDWAKVYSTILMDIHGKRFRVTLEDDPTHYYVGRVKVSDYKSDKERGTISIDYTLNPYKTPWFADDENDEWKWNQLFGLDKILYGKFRVTGNKIRTIINSDIKRVQIYTNSTAPFLAYQYESEDSYVVLPNPIPIGSGIHEQDSQLLVDPGRTKFRFEGTGEITLYYKEGLSL